MSQTTIKRILAIDTSSENCSIALQLETGERVSKHISAPRSHTQLALPMVKELLEENKLSLDDVDAIAFGKGPGSFTGVRIAAGIAQGLAFGADKPIYGISNLQALAINAFEQFKQSYVLVAIDARMSEVYAALYKVKLNDIHASYELEEIIPECVVAPEKLVLGDLKIQDQDIVGVGSGFAFFDQFPKALREQISQYDETIEPEAKSVCILCQNEINTGGKGDINEALPSYVRDTVTWKKLPGRE